MRAVRAALPRSGAGSEAYLGLLGRRLAALEEWSRAPRSAPLHRRPGDLRVSRRFLEPREGTWDDGDENLVRGSLDRWQRSDADPARAAAAALAQTARSLAGLHARPETLWFFLWEMESMLAGLETEAMG